MSSQFLEYVKWNLRTKRKGMSPMKIKILLIAFALFSACAIFAADRQTYRNAQGRTTGTASTSGNHTMYRDAQGRTAGTATTNGNTTVYRDTQGRTSGTKR